MRGGLDLCSRPKLVGYNDVLSQDDCAFLMVRTRWCWCWCHALLIMTFHDTSRFPSAVVVLGVLATPPAPAHVENSGGSHPVVDLQGREQTDLPQPQPQPQPQLQPQQQQPPQPPTRPIDRISALEQRLGMPSQHGPPFPRLVFLEQQVTESAPAHEGPFLNIPAHITWLEEAFERAGY